MTGADILKSPVRVHKDSERLYFDAPGEVCVDVCSGKPEDRARVLALLGEVQRMAQVLMAVQEWDVLGREFPDAPRRSPMPEVRGVLRDAGVMSGGPLDSEGT